MKRVWFKPEIRVVVRKQPPMKEDEIDVALAVREHSALWRAVHQLIDTAEENAHANAAADLAGQPGYVGGAAHLRMLRDELARRRERGIGILGAAKPEEAE